MARVSKEKLKKNVLDQINFGLIDTITRLESNNSTKNFVNDLLGDSEKIVLAKRLAIIFMLQENISWYKISKALKVSPATVKRIAIDIDLEKYKDIIEIIKQKKNRVTFWEGLDKVLKCGMPPIVGKGRWNFLNKY
ncbi:MAG: helix-turn-helix domain-containing protein [Candidatus Pacebacteria bacterium]|nr:helix-turn-helix domain-containing protein [Candidatus Paceibacterota bacterium]